MVMCLKLLLRNPKLESNYFWFLHQHSEPQKNAKLLKCICCDGHAIMPLEYTKKRGEDGGSRGEFFDLFLIIQTSALIQWRQFLPRRSLLIQQKPILMMILLQKIKNWTILGQFRNREKKSLKSLFVIFDTFLLPFFSALLFLVVHTINFFPSRSTSSLWDDSMRRVSSKSHKNFDGIRREREREERGGRCSIAASHSPVTNMGLGMPWLERVRERGG